MGFAKIEDAVAAIGRGEIVVVVDDEDRENEGDLIMAAEFVTPEKIAFFLHHTSGYICAPITSERARELELNAMVQQNTESQRTAFLVSVDYIHGTSTGISAFDRAATISALVDPATRPDDLARPGHILPLEAREGGVLKRAGHTAATASALRVTCSAHCAACADHNWPPRCRRSPRTIAARSCTCGATKAGASASATRSVRTGCRTRASTPSTLTYSCGCPPTGGST